MNPEGKTEYRDLDALGLPGYRIGSDLSLWSRHRRGTTRLADTWVRLATGCTNTVLSVGGTMVPVHLARLAAQAFGWPAPPARRYPKTHPQSVRAHTRKLMIAGLRAEGLTLQEIADKLGVTKARVQQIIPGRTPRSYRRAVKK